MARADTGSSPLPVGAEIDSLRTADTNTYVGVNGTLVQDVYQDPVNYKDAGTWQPIDNTLTGGPLGYENTANRLQVDLPGNLGSEPVRVSDGSQWLTFSLNGASGFSSIPSGTSETYFGALPGVDLTFTATGETLKESAVLLDASSQRSLSYSVSTSSGLTAAEQPDGSIDFLDGSGRGMFSFSPARLSDAAGADGLASYQLTPTATGYEVTLDPNSAWLSSPDRVWPVTIDPSISDDSAFYQSKTPAPTQDGYVFSGNPTSNWFGLGYERVGWNSQGVRRTLQQYSPVLPKGARVLHARLNEYMQAESAYTGASVGVYSMTTHQWTTGATWNTYDGTNSWSNLGGDFASEPSQNGNPWAKTTLGGNSATGWYYWDITQLVASWRNEDVSNLGLMLKYVNETTNSNIFTLASGTASGSKPSISITYTLGIGDTGGYSFEHFPLGNSTTIDVNRGNGNVLACHTDLSVPGVNGFDLNLKQCWNSLAGDPNGTMTGHWLLAPGQTTYLDEIGGQTIVYHDDTGVTQPFTQIGTSGVYISPLDFNATLAGTSGNLSACSSQPGGGAFNRVLTFSTDGSKDYFNGGELIAKADHLGDAICFSYLANGNLSSITDTHGQTICFYYTGNRLDSFKFPSSADCTANVGQTYQFGYDLTTSPYELKTFTPPAGTTISYGYNPSNGNLTSVTDQGGQTVLTDYTTYGEGWAVGTVKQHAESASPIATAFVYGDTTDSFCSSSTTAITYPDGDTARYCFHTGLHQASAKGVPPTLSTPGINGTAQVGNTLTAPSVDLGAPMATASYQWQVSPDGATWTDAPGAGARTPTYTVDPADYNNYLRVVIVATNTCDLGCGSAPSPAFLGPALPKAPSGGHVYLTGYPVAGDNLDATPCESQGWSPSRPAPTCIFHWQVSSARTGPWSDVESGNNDYIYALVASEVGKYLRATVDASNTGGHAPPISSQPALIRTHRLPTTETAYTHPQGSGGLGDCSKREDPVNFKLLTPNHILIDKAPITGQYYRGPAFGVAGIAAYFWNGGIGSTPSYYKFPDGCLKDTDHATNSGQSGGYHIRTWQDTGADAHEPPPVRYPPDTTGAPYYPAFGGVHHDFDCPKEPQFGGIYDSHSSDNYVGAVNMLMKNLVSFPHSDQNPYPPLPDGGGYFVAGAALLIRAPNDLQHCNQLGVDDGLLYRLLQVAPTVATLGAGDQ